MFLLAWCCCYHSLFGRYISSQGKGRLSPGGRQYPARRTASSHMDILVVVHGAKGLILSCTLPSAVDKEMENVSFRALAPAVLVNRQVSSRENEDPACL
jgi:hypothetical protein